MIVRMRAAAFAATVLSGFFGSSALDSGGLGLTSAEAKEYYTKKRVNGRWIAGRFPKKSAVKARRMAKAAPKAAPAMPAPAPEAPMPPARPGDVGPTASPIAATSVKATPAAPPADDDHMRKLQEALQARAPSLLVTSVAEPAPSAEDPGHPQETASLGRAPVPGVRSEPSSVTFDFQSGVKTTIFGDGAVATEPFDVRSMRELAVRRSAPPAR
jgi:hypothetical protein